MHPFGDGGMKGRRCKDGSKSFCVVFIHCSSSSSRILVASVGFMVTSKIISVVVMVKITLEYLILSVNLTTFDEIMNERME